MEDFTGPHPLLPSRRELARSGNKQEILDCSLVLSSQGIKHWMEFDGGEWSLAVDEREGPLASGLIDTWRTENVGFQDAPLEKADLDLLVSPLLFLAVPVAAYFLVESGSWVAYLHNRGIADSGRILAGEWWRCFTAATLHADDGHFLSNLVSGYFILNLLNHRLGIGTLMLLATLGAGIDNFLVALVSGPEHRSLGYSSVVFCALGLLAAAETLGLARRRLEHRDRFRAQGARDDADGAFWNVRLRRLSPLISALFVAVLVGLGENVDVKAHFYGFGIGAALGLATWFQPATWKRPAMQAIFTLTSYGIFAFAWFLATRY